MRVMLALAPDISIAKSPPDSAGFSLAWLGLRLTAAARFAKRAAAAIEGALSCVLWDLGWANLLFCLYMDVCHKRQDSRVCGVLDPRSSDVFWRAYRDLCRC